MKGGFKMYAEVFEAIWQNTQGTANRLDKYKRWYKQIESIINQDLEGFMESFNDYIKIKNEGYMDLNIDKLTDNRIALSHYYKHPSGDMIPDPDIEVIVDTERKIVYPVAYQDTYGYSVAYEYDANGEIVGVNPKVKSSIESFFGQWLKNLQAQGFKACVACAPSCFTTE